MSFRTFKLSKLSNRLLGFSAYCLSCVWVYKTISLSVGLLVYPWLETKFHENCSTHLTMFSFLCKSFEANWELGLVWDSLASYFNQSTKFMNKNPWNHSTWWLLCWFYYKRLRINPELSYVAFLAATVFLRETSGLGSTQGLARLIGSFLAVATFRQRYA